MKFGAESFRILRYPVFPILQVNRIAHASVSAIIVVFLQKKEVAVSNLSRQIPFLGPEGHTKIVGIALLRHDDHIPGNGVPPEDLVNNQARFHVTHGIVPVCSSWRRDLPGHNQVADLLQLLRLPGQAEPLRRRRNLLNLKIPVRAYHEGQGDQADDQEHKENISKV